MNGRPSGKGKTGKAYRYGVELATADKAAGNTFNLEFSATWIPYDQRNGNPDFRPTPQPRGFYHSEIARGYRDGWQA